MFSGAHEPFLTLHQLSSLPPSQHLSFSVFALTSRKLLYVAKGTIWETHVRQGVLSPSIPSPPLSLEQYRIFGPP